MILFLKEYSDMPYENCYYILGDYCTVVDVSRDADGNAYVLDNFTIFLERSMEASPVDEVREVSVRQRVFAEADRMDPLMDYSNVVYGQLVVVTMEEFEKLMH